MKKTNEILQELEFDQLTLLEESEKNAYDHFNSTYSKYMKDSSVESQENMTENESSDSNGDQQEEKKEEESKESLGFVIKKRNTKWKQKKEIE